MKQVNRKFGADPDSVIRMKTRACTTNSNPKGGMNVKEFKKYLEKNIVLLYRDACDIRKKKGDVPDIPNTTYIAQPTDQN